MEKPNTAKITTTSTILDPMCGSGTTPAEAVLLGCQAIGIDFNPLSVLISQVKCKILTVSPDELLNEYETIKAKLLTQLPNTSNDLPWFEQLSAKDQDYLSRWFAPQTLTDLDPIAMQISRTKRHACRALFQVSLSNIIRRVSWQKNDDL